MSMRKSFVVLFVSTMFWGPHKCEHVRVEKRSQINPSTLADVAKILTDYAKRIKDLESKQGWCKDGAPGAPGLPGKPGKDGRDGVGLPGKDGTNGIPGKDGINGLPGKDGASGKDGVGLPGSPGPRGRDGRDGLHGTPGPRGSPGLQGLRGAQGLKGPPGPKSAGVQYIRWGRTSCPSGANLVYKGRVGGEDHNNPGGGSNYVCLTEAPKYASYTNALKTVSALMYGAEYQVHSANHPNPFNNKNLHDHDVPCAVCFIPNRNAKLMIPATYECPLGWSKEYWGYLMTEYYKHPNQRNFICVDQDAEPVKGTFHNHNGALLYGVQGRCGSLPCLPYVEGRELTCVVCTK
ncbi:collagen alpha-1(IV) chain [Exaiptasia diaphana]|uniref:Short-chain collagen C4-like n=1 Tax=Exaiptasia diaphana TaxID=2652724 RepID=A0A913YU11_EXADI|nr:collagen alpha-1(IV) chain [Exaiptasia diaphana]